MASPQTLFGGEGRAYFINWFGVGNGVSFSLVSLVSWVVEMPHSLWFRFLTLFSFIF